MLRQAARRLLSSGSRAFTTSSSRFEEAAIPAGPEVFKDVWSKKAPSTLAPPEFPSNFVSVGSSGDSQAQGDLFPVNFYTPHGVIADNTKKESVVLPGMDGVFGVKANHVPLIAQLKPGIVELHAGGDTGVEKYFVSGGFAFVHPNGVTDICVLEAATLDEVDPAAVKQALNTAVAAQTAGDEYDQAVTRAAVELYGALDSALESKA